ncbi:MAG: hypothetical protein GY847_38605 [Proteobacteria bacterium]|nr:hypothetical protein [Pseudomonadota bacterium]
MSIWKQKKKRLNVQELNSLRKQEIEECVLCFRKSRNLPDALLKYFSEQGVDIDRSILVSNYRMPFGGPTEAYCGIWLTQNKRFISFEIFLDENDARIDEIEEWADITDATEVSDHKKGIKKTFGALCMEIFDEANETTEEHE